MNRSSNPTDPLPRIPTPTGQRWREFRIQTLPLLVFLGAVVAAGVVWRQNIAAPTLQGEVEAVRAEVSSPQPGILTQLKVARFQKVARGDAVAIVLPTDPRPPLALLQSELDVLRARLDPRLTQQRNATDYERLRLEWLLQKVDLASTRVSLARAENEHRRHDELFKAKLISADLFDLTLKTRDQLQVVVDEKAKLIADLELGLERLKTLGDFQTNSPTAEAMLAGIKGQEEKLLLAEAKLGPITLLAPIDGTVSAVYRHPGENVRDGDPIITVSALESQRIVGYLRQPFPLEPQIGMAVEVRTRAQKSIVRPAQILHIGSQLELITNSLAILRPGAPVDMGLPLEISLPPELKTRPGELVDLTIRPQPQ